MTNRTGLPFESASRARRHRLAISFAPVLAIWCQMALCGAAHAAGPKDSGPADAVAVPTAFQLQLVYADRTWIWDNGAAYFGQKDRPVRAWTSEQDTASVGEGRWHLSNDGKMCMDLVWRSKTYAAAPIRTCFSHRFRSGTLEQRKDPDGVWYSFRHSPGDPSDEQRKFEEGDTKGAQFDKIRTSIDSKS
ncbi:DUF995 domain-containing protein [Mesorhizobium sp. M1060]|uniref:DUF995 domain-containing protein n=1 Tax=unclassified Mesorhizobium TaxID=325217 RepID=UPI001FD8819F|nr:MULTISPECIES: DUF995 domain-containing protein [unclassified Mesorhizobium]